MHGKSAAPKKKRVPLFAHLIYSKPTNKKRKKSMKNLLGRVVQNVHFRYIVCDKWCSQARDLPSNDVY